MNLDSEKILWKCAARIGRLAERHARGELAPPRLAEFDAALLLRCYHGGSWRAIFALAWWEWKMRWSPRSLLVSGWLWWGDKSGRFVTRNGQRHAKDCQADYMIEATSPEGVEDDCIAQASPAWIRRWME